MSIFGRLAAGAGAGAASIASRYVDEEIANNRATFLADLQHQNMVRADEYQNSEPVTTRNRARVVADSDALAGAKLGQDKARASDTGLAEAEAGRETILSKAKAAAARDDVKAAGGDTEFLAAQGKIKLADPEVAARIAASRASAASAYASAGQSNAQTEGIKLNNADKRKLDVLYDKADALLTNEAITDDVRGKELTKLQQQVALIKSKTGQGGAARDPELDTVTTKETKDDGKGGVTETTTKAVRRPGQGAQSEAPDPYAVPKSGAKPAASQKPAAKPTSTDDGSKGVQFVKTGYGTGYYRYAGKNYPTMAEAQAAKTQWDNTPAEDIYKQPD